MSDRVSITTDGYHKAYYRSVDNPVNLSEYRRIVSKLFKVISDKILEGHDVILPNLGVMGVRGKKVKPRLNSEGDIRGLAPNWVATKKAWQADANKRGLDYKTYLEEVKREDRPAIAYHFNEHSNGLRYTICWFSDTVKIKNRTIYSFKFCRANKRNVSKLIMSGKEYTEIKLKEDKL